MTILENYRQYLNKNTRIDEILENEHRSPLKVK